MKIQLNAGIDRAKTLNRLMNGAKPQDFIVQAPFHKTVQNSLLQKSNSDSCIASGLMVSVKNILDIIAKGK